MLVYKTPTIVSTDLFDLEKLGDPRSTEGIRLLGMFPGFDSKNCLETTGKRGPHVIDLGCEAGSTRRLCKMVRRCTCRNWPAFKLFHNGRNQN